MQAQTPQRKAELSIEIEKLIAGDLKQTIAYHINRYRKSFDRRLGMTEDDILNDIRIQIWKGLITWAPDGRANKKTYLNNLIKKRFSTLHRRTQIEKYSAVEYYADVFSSPARYSMDPDRLETHETGEDLLLRRQEQMRDQEVITDPTHLHIFEDLLKGLSIEEMMSRHKMTRVRVVGAVREITTRIAERRENTAKGPI